MADLRQATDIGPTYRFLLTDPAASFAVEPGVTSWRDRDWLDAAGDAGWIAGVFETEADRLTGRMSWPSG